MRTLVRNGVVHLRCRDGLAQLLLCLDGQRFTNSTPWTKVNRGLIFVVYRQLRMRCCVWDLL
jgi:hypothetical protein